MDTRDFIMIGVWVLFAIVSIGSLVHKIYMKFFYPSKKSSVVIPIGLVAIIFTFAVVISMGNMTRHDLMSIQDVGLKYEAEGRYDEAYDTYLIIYGKMGDWSDIKECIERVRTPALYMKAEKQLSEDEFLDAAMNYYKILGYSDADDKFNLCLEKYLEGIK